MKLYLASRYARRDELRIYAERLTAAGHIITSRWLQEKTDPLHDLNDVTEEHNRQAAFDDLYDLSDADALIFFSESPLLGHVRGARHVEYGIALTLGRPITVIGPKENIFHFMPQITHFNSFDEFCDRFEIT